MSIHFEDFEKLVLSRRTTKDFDGRAVDRDTIEKLLKLAVWAPNHRLNEPWRFYVCTHGAIPEWIEHLRTKIDAQSFLPLQKSLERFKKVGAAVYVSVKKEKNEIIDWENYAAACAAVQNILLGAEALGLASFWSTGKAMAHPQSRSFLNVDQNERFVGCIWLGHAATKPEAKARKPLTEVSFWT